MKTQLMIMRNEFNENSFITPIGNRGDNKPDAGGVWTSSLIGKHSSQWDLFTSTEGFYEGETIVKHIVEPKENARVLTINTREDYESALSKYGIEANRIEHPVMLYEGQVLDYNKVMVDYDCMRLTEKGLYSNNLVFHTWDIESTLWFNVDNFDIVDTL